MIRRGTWNNSSFVAKKTKLSNNLNNRQPPKISNINKRTEQDSKTSTHQLSFSEEAASSAQQVVQRPAKKIRINAMSHTETVNFIRTPRSGPVKRF